VGGLPLSVWIMSGKGFPLHTDTVPPFDITLDLVVDHVGETSRPITFVRRSKEKGKEKKGIVEETISLEVGQAVLFKGSELTHYSTRDLPPNHYHNVVLFTWNYVRD
jgi:hypothetical protein